ncbi:hypothetical protein V9L05_13630 [Bernardetia sp. Wsw4-3y2]|uniref:hypothetical protein n=1 Tax=Bernardetia sp. Wsw4-3y2 TaxID=3127471 RepID=UPI0030D4B70A
MKKRNIDYLSIEDVEEIIDFWWKRIQNEKDRIKNNINRVYDLLTKTYLPISADTYFVENDNPLDIFRDDNEDIIYINGQFFLLQQEHSKYVTLENSEEIKKLNEESHESMKKNIFRYKEWIVMSLESIERNRERIKNLEYEIAKKKKK